MLDSPAVKAGLNDLWQRSNPDRPQAERMEQGGWIVQHPDGTFGMAPFQVTRQGPCSIAGNFFAPPNAVAWVHTHPYRTGEVQTICGAFKVPNGTGGWTDLVGPNGQPIYPVYKNRPSTNDYELMNDVNATQAQLDRAPLTGVIIDHKQTTVFTEDQSQKPTALQRCGY